MEIKAQSPPQNGKISILLLPKFYLQQDISKKVSLSIRRLKELNLNKFF